MNFIFTFQNAHKQARRKNDKTQANENKVVLKVIILDRDLSYCHVISLLDASLMPPHKGLCISKHWLYTKDFCQYRFRKKVCCHTQSDQCIAHCYIWQFTDRNVMATFTFQVKPGEIFKVYILVEGALEIQPIISACNYYHVLFLTQLLFLFVLGSVRLPTA